MSDEKRVDEETEVEIHGNRAGMQEEPVEDAEDEFEAHIRVPNVRMD
jgi:hypothetical protein